MHSHSLLYRKWKKTGQLEFLYVNDNEKEFFLFYHDKNCAILIFIYKINYVIGMNISCLILEWHFSICLALIVSRKTLQYLLSFNGRNNSICLNSSAEAFQVLCTLNFLSKSEPEMLLRWVWCYLRRHI